MTRRNVTRVTRLALVALLTATTACSPKSSQSAIDESARADSLLNDSLSRATAPAARVDSTAMPTPADSVAKPADSTQAAKPSAKPAKKDSNAIPPGKLGRDRAMPVDPRDPKRQFPPKKPE
jgi:hypothetical protein